MMTPSEFAEKLASLSIACAKLPEGELTVHEESVAQSALLTLAGLLGSASWRLCDEHDKRAKAAASLAKTEANAAAAAMNPEPTK